MCLASFMALIGCLHPSGGLSSAHVVVMAWTARWMYLGRGEMLAGVFVGHHAFVASQHRIAGCSHLEAFSKTQPPAGQGGMARESTQPHNQVMPRVLLQDSQTTQACDPHRLQTEGIGRNTAIPVSCNAKHHHKSLTLVSQSRPQRLNRGSTSLRCKRGLPWGCRRSEDIWHTRGCPSWPGGAPPTSQN